MSGCAERTNLGRELNFFRQERNLGPICPFLAHMGGVEYKVTAELAVTRPRCTLRSALAYSVL
jgi:hypothetical protein